MPALSAPSAKILTARSSTFFMVNLALYDCQRFLGRRDLVIVSFRRRFPVSAIDKNRTAARSDARLHVAAAIPNHVAATEIDVEFRCATQQHPRPRFPALTAVAIV